MNQTQLNTLKDRFIFVDYEENKKGVDITPSEVSIDGLTLSMTKVVLSDYSLLYDALAEKKVTIPVRLLRRLKQDLYEYVITSTPTATIQVANIDDKRISDDDLALAIGKASDLSLRGLSGISSDDWYRNIILGDLGWDADDLLKYAFHNLSSQNSGRLPVNKLLHFAHGSYKEAEDTAKKYDFNAIISNTIKITIFSRRREIEIMRLVGASNINIKIPFIFEGLFLGIMGSILPIIATVYGYNLLYDNFDGQLFSPFIKLVEPEPFVLFVSLALLVIGILVGMFGSWRAVKKHLKI